MPWLRPRSADYHSLSLFTLCQLALIAFNSEVRSCTVSGGAATCCFWVHSLCVCALAGCLLIMIMMIEIVFSPSPLFGIFLCIYALPICSRCHHHHHHGGPLVWPLQAVCVCRFADHLLHFTRRTTEKRIYWCCLNSNLMVFYWKIFTLSVFGSVLYKILI